MLQILQNGTALYLMAAICLIGMISKMTAKNSYKRMIKETNNMAMTKNKYLRTLKQKAEDAYRVGQGIPNAKVYLERQLFDARIGLMTPAGWAGFSSQANWLCLLAGGTLAFLAYWYRCDTYYIVLYGSAGILAAVLNIIVENGTGLERHRQQLLASLQDYLENSLWHRMELERSSSPSEDGARMTDPEPVQPARSNVRELRDRKNPRRAMEQRTITETAASRDRGREKIPAKEAAGKTADGADDGSSWMKELKPEEIRVLGEIIREYLG